MIQMVGDAVTTTEVGTRIERARVAAGLSQRALADTTGISQSTLSRVISGQRAAKLPELVAIAWATGVTVAELAGTGTVAERAEYAARATNHTDMDGMREALLHFLELDDYLSGQAIPATVLSEGTLTAEAEGSAFAAQFRHDHHLGVQPLGDLVAIIEQATGIDVAVLDVGPDEHGLTMRDPARGTVYIGVARTRNPMRQRSTLAHELGHVLFRDWADSDAGDWSDRNPAETRADAFARHLLVPVEGLRDFIGDRSVAGVSALSPVVQRFLVSPPIAAIALCRAGYIDEATKRDWMTLSTPHLAARYGWTDQYRVLQANSDQRRAPQRLLARAITGYVEGVLPLQAIATLRGITPEAMLEEFHEAGVTPVERPIAWADPADLPEVQVDLAALDEALAAADDGDPDATASKNVR
jgi:Zn-dependent peptidase ImmA (M78 family)/transcriptional regulator with XRE-family HTH domain